PRRRTKPKTTSRPRRPLPKKRRPRRRPPRKRPPTRRTRKKRARTPNRKIRPHLQAKGTPPAAARCRAGSFFLGRVAGRRRIHGLCCCAADGKRPVRQAPEPAGNGLTLRVIAVILT